MDFYQEINSKTDPCFPRNLMVLRLTIPVLARFYLERERIDPGSMYLTCGAGWMLKGSELCEGERSTETWSFHHIPGLPQSKLLSNKILRDRICSLGVGFLGKGYSKQVAAY